MKRIALVLAPFALASAALAQATLPDVRTPMATAAGRWSSFRQSGPT
jgi:hypothetical protein